MPPSHCPSTGTVLSVGCRSTVERRRPVKFQFRWDTQLPVSGHQHAPGTVDRSTSQSESHSSSQRSHHTGRWRYLGQLIMTREKLNDHLPLFRHSEVELIHKNNASVWFVLLMILLVFLSADGAAEVATEVVPVPIAEVTTLVDCDLLSVCRPTA